MATSPWRVLRGWGGAWRGPHCGVPPCWTAVGAAEHSRAAPSLPALLNPSTASRMRLGCGCTCLAVVGPYPTLHLCNAAQGAAPLPRQAPPPPPSSHAAQQRPLPAGALAGSGPESVMAQGATTPRILAAAPHNTAPPGTDGQPGARSGSGWRSMVAPAVGAAQRGGGATGEGPGSSSKVKVISGLRPPACGGCRCSCDMPPSHEHESRASEQTSERVPSTACWPWELSLSAQDSGYRPFRGFFAQGRALSAVPPPAMCVCLPWLPWAQALTVGPQIHGSRLAMSRSRWPVVCGGAWSVEGPCIDGVVLHGARRRVPASSRRLRQGLVAAAAPADLSTRSQPGAL